MLASNLRLVPRVALAIATVVVALRPPHAPAQYAVDQRVQSFQQPTGRMFDVNPSVYGGRLNDQIRPISPLMLGNATATGNVGRGLSLRSGSPIGDPTAFGAPLGSASLYSFRRDSVSSGDALSPAFGQSFAQPYYDPATTAYTGGFLQGQPTPYGPSARGVQPLDLRVPYRLEAQRGQFGRPVSPPIRDAASAAVAPSIFGPSTAIPRAPLSEADQRSAWWVAEDDVARMTAMRPTDARDQWRQGLADRGVMNTSLEAILRGETAWRLGPEGSVALGAESPGTYRPGLIVPEGIRAEARQPGLAPPPLADPTVLPGYDVFTDMRLALALESNPRADWFAEMKKAAGAQPELAPTAAETAAQGAEEFIEGMLKSPIRTLTGKGASGLNDQMLKAESLMSIGHFTEAADRYQTAHMMDPTNPLPLIGRGHALLAAGEYRSAAAALLDGLRAFPDLARFQLDLTTLLGGGENVDIRRADLMKRLAERESPELNFLLGYLEYHAGSRDRGLQAMEKAAQLDVRGLGIGSYLSTLRGVRGAPAPGAPPSNVQPAEPRPAPDQAEPSPPPEPSDPLSVPPPVP